MLALISPTEVCVRMEVFSDNLHLVNLGCTLHGFQQGNRYTDIIVTVEHGKQFYAHRNLLAASSPFWVSMFETGFIESNQNAVTLDNIRSEAFYQILHFVYSGRFEVTCDSVVSLYEAANYLQYDHIMNCCLKFISENINSDTYSNYLKLSEKFQLFALRLRIGLFMKKNFEPLSESSGFYQLPIATVQEVLSSDELVAPSEKTVLNVVIHYLQTNRELSKDECQNFVDQLRYGLFKSGEMTDLWQLEPFIGSKSIFEIQHDLAAYLLDRFRQPLLCSYFFKPRCSPKLLILGGANAHIPACTGENTLTNFTVMDYQIFNMIEDKIPSRKLPEKTLGFATVLAGNFIYVLGGEVYLHGSSSITRNAYRYDIVNDEWLIIAKLPRKRRDHIAALSGKTIVVLAGTDGCKPYLDAVDAYDIATNTWKSKTPFPQCTLAVSICEGDGAVWLCGNAGDGAGHNCRLFFRYEPVADVWLQKGLMDIPCDLHTLHYYNEMLYMIGGGKNQDFLCYFDIQSRKSAILTRFPFPRYLPASVLHAGQIYVIGGCGPSDDDKNSWDATDTVFVYDISLNTWMENIGSAATYRLPYTVSGSQCAVAFSPSMLLPVREKLNLTDFN